MKKPFYLQEEFKQWMFTELKVSGETATSYFEYIEEANSKYLLFAEADNSKSDLFEMLDSHVPYGNWSRMDDAILYIIQFLNIKDITEKMSVSNDSLRNWVEALFHYRDFLDFYMETKINPMKESNFDDDDDDDDYAVFSGYKFDFIEKEESTKTENLNLCSVYSLTDLCKILKLRISYQDMYNHPVYYPLNLIKQILWLKGEKPFFENFIKNLVDNIDIHVANKKVKFKIISKIEINNGQVIVRHKGTNEKIFTKLSDNKTFKPFVANSFNGIAIDYEIPLLEILDLYKKEFSVISSISAELQECNKDVECPNELKIISREILQSEFANCLNIDNLKSELQFLSSKLKLQLMDREERRMKVILDIL
jgi:hypothetical protein